MEIEIEKKPPKDFEKNIKIQGSDDVIKIDEVNEIRNATQEHVLFLGLDRAFNLRTIKLIGIGTSSGTYINAKDVLRTALLTASDNVVLVHNHPSNSLKASKEDKNITNRLCKFLNVFNINLADHIIVTEESHLSMLREKQIDKNYSNDDIEFVENELLLEENIRLKNELKNMEEKYMNKYESVIIIKPTLTDEETKDTINKYKENFEKFSNQPVKVEDLGKKKLAYEIQGNKEGSYAVFTFYGKPEDISKTERQYRIDDNVMKFITVKMDMEAEEDPEVMEDEDDMEME